VFGTGRVIDVVERTTEMRVAVIWNHLFHYRIPLYRLLGQMPGIDLTVYHGGGALEDANAGGPQDSFRSVTVVTRAWGLAGAVVYVQTPLLTHIARGRYDVIVCEGNFGILSNLPILVYGRIARVPVIAWTGGWERGGIKGLAAVLRRVYIRMVSRLPRGYICYGTSAREFLAGFGVPRSKCAIIQNTIDVEGTVSRRIDYARAGEQERRERGLSGKMVILAVGELRPQKEVAVLLEAFRRVRAVRDGVALVVIGDGPERAMLEAITVEKGIRDVTFLGSVVADVGRFFAMSDIFVLPGDGGLAINEAMAHGLPVICSTADGTEKDLVIEAKTGLFFTRGDAQELSARMDALLSSPETLRNMGRAARDHVFEIATLNGAVERFAHVLRAYHEGGRPRRQGSCASRESVCGEDEATRSRAEAAK
jgi:glycosyltransferase involved in cell wall biosynthesis